MFITPHATYDQRHARNRKHKDEHRAGDLVPDIRQRVLREDGEIIRLVWGHAAAAAQQFTHLVLGFRHVRVRCRFDADEMLFKFRMEFAQCRQWEINLVVVRILAAAERALDLFRRLSVDSGK